MKYLAIDLETTGLDPEKHQIVEFAAVLADTEDFTTPVEELPFFQTLVAHDEYTVSPEAYQMNPGMISSLLGVDQQDGSIIHITSLADLFKQWYVESNNMVMPVGRLTGITLAGKNVASFDKPFLDQVPGMKDRFGFHHRFLDPTSFFTMPSDEKPPNLEECVERASASEEFMMYDFSSRHRALPDARVVVELIREGMRHPV